MKFSIILSLIFSTICADHIFESCDLNMEDLFIVGLANQNNVDEACGDHGGILACDPGRQTTQETLLKYLALRRAVHKCKQRVELWVKNCDGGPNDPVVMLYKHDALVDAGFDLVEHFALCQVSEPKALPRRSQTNAS